MAMNNGRIDFSSIGGLLGGEWSTKSRGGKGRVSKTWTPAAHHSQICPMMQVRKNNLVGKSTEFT
jgi:hypothetical protein